MSTPANPKDGRKVILINPRFQLTFLGYMVGMSFVAIIIFYIANRYFFWTFRQMGTTLGLPPDHIFFQFIGEQQTKMNVVFGVTSLAVFIALSIGGIVFSHWVAGPLYRLKRHLRDIASGKTMADVKFRKRDFFPELADGFNEMMRSFRERLGASPAPAESAPVESGSQPSSPDSGA
jgi:methyl-accepting chemotaxis protein